MGPSVLKNDPSLVYYGPHPCQRGCGVMIVKAGNGAPDYLEFEFPSDLLSKPEPHRIYPNTPEGASVVWIGHYCPVANKELRFSDALELLRNGYRIARKGWNGKGMFLKLQVPDEHSKMTTGYIYITPSADQRVPWVASQVDILATDWFEVVD